jgi:hypothetical protein
VGQFDGHAVGRLADDAVGLRTSAMRSDERARRPGGLRAARSAAASSAASRGMTSRLR